MALVESSWKGQIMHIAIDTGGTFTDCIYVEDAVLKVLKVFSAPEDPGGAVVDAVRTASNGSTPSLRHGTTVGTNVLLERKGARVAKQCAPRYRNAFQRELCRGPV